MIRWVLLDTATVPGDGGELQLMQRGSEYSIMSGPVVLMNSRKSGSEEALASLAAARLVGRAAAQVLIGGYGMGFTLRAALKAFGPDVAITVGELVPEVIAWGRGPMAGLSGDSLDDPRLTLREGDIGGMIASATGDYDAILLDVDNGPEGLSRPANDRLYDAQGLAAARRALRPGGLLAIWSSYPDDRFSKRLRHAGFAVEAVRVRSTGGGKGEKHVIWVATKPA